MQNPQTPLAPASTNIVDDWNDVLAIIIKEQKPTSYIQSRSLSMMNTAIYRALKNLGYPCANPREDASVLAVSHAAYGVCVALFNTEYRAVGDDLMRTVSRKFPSSKLNYAITIGRQAAVDVLQSRVDDNSNFFKDYIVDPTPGKWVPTLDNKGEVRPPNPFFPHWRDVTPFGVYRAAPYVAPPPPKFTSDKYFADMKEVKELGDAGATDTQASERTSIANFWAGNIFSPHAIWLNIARAALAKKGNSDIFQYAATYMLASSAGADGRIVAYRSKYIYNTWRPETAIGSEISVNSRLDTLKDPNFKPVLTSPLHPEFPSGHASVCWAIGNMLASILGDNISFEIGTADSDTNSQKFDSFSDAANQCGVSRIFGGIHFRFAIDAGKEIGRKLADDGLGRLCPNGSCLKCRSNSNGYRF